MKDQSFRTTLEKVAQASFLNRNSIQVLKDGHPAFEEVFRALEKAERFICLDLYIFRDDETGRALAESLARKSREGVQIFRYQPRVLHAKTMVFDGHWSIVGSANLDSRSLNYNYECGVGVLDEGVGEEMERVFQHDLTDSVPVTEEDLSRWPLHERALGTFFSYFRSYLQTGTSLGPILSLCSMGNNG